MMTNLFSTFDPATSVSISLNWTSTFWSFMLIPIPFWLMPNRMNYMINLILNKLHLDFKMLLHPSAKGMTLIMISTFFFILTNNMIGLMPYTFTSSSHMTFTMTLAIPLWVSFMLFGWINNTNHMFAHLVPSGTPSVLMPFMVLIETISNLMRPGSLAVRLMANMIAGHLLMSLLGNNALNTNQGVLIFINMIQVILMMFEAAVAVIQAYVFTVLVTLYSSEV